MLSYPRALSQGRSQAYASPRARFHGQDPPGVPVGKTNPLLPPAWKRRHPHLIDEGFQAFNAARLGEACRIFTDKMLLPENDTTIGLTVAGALTPAGLGGCIVEMMERGLVDFVISTGANLYHDLHYALNFTLHRGRRSSKTWSSTTRGHPHLRRLVPVDGAARDRPLYP
jgi:hypothetical protein